MPEQIEEVGKEERGKREVPQEKEQEEGKEKEKKKSVQEEEAEVVATVDM